jgi:hypothetical protein
MLLLAAGARDIWSDLKADRDLAARIDAVAQRRADAVVEPCPMAGEAGSLVLLVLGQSNAANQGGTAMPTTPERDGRITVFAGDQCARSGDPLPGGTGRSRSIWSGLEDALTSNGVRRRVVVALLAVDSTSIDDWTRPSSPLHERLERLIDSMLASGLRPDFVLWQQGESDARRGTSAGAYVQGFERLRETVRRRGVASPMLLAKSTYCRNPATGAIRSAIDHLVAAHADLRMGPDTDALVGSMRVDDCHFSDAGLQAAAGLWAAAIASQLP